MNKQIKNISNTIDYIENHLTEKLSLETIALSLNYSKYHLHRIFKKTVGMTIHDYILRRKLSEAAKYLVFSHKSILEIALLSGYESQQAFSFSFKQMYKKSPNQYREDQIYYPLQLKYTLHPLESDNTKTNWENKINYATLNDITKWMDLVTLIIDGFPNLQNEQYLTALKKAIKNNLAYILIEEEIAIGAMIFNNSTGNIEFFGIHPQFRQKQIEQAFLNKILKLWNDDITITTFRENDKADLNQRQIIKQLGFVEAELLYEYSYPTQKFILSNKEDYYNE